VAAWCKLCQARTECRLIPLRTDLDVANNYSRLNERASRRPESAFGAFYTNDNKAELMIVVIVVICRLTQKYAQMQHPLFGRRG